MRRAIFPVCATVGFCLCHGLALLILPSSWQAAPMTRPDPWQWYVSHYADFGLDYYVTRFGLLGVGQHIQDADIICSSSSKGLYGFDAELLSEKLSTPGHPVRVYNLSFGYGEGFIYMMEVVKKLDLRDKILVADLTDNTSGYHLTRMARLAMETTSTFGAYKVYLEKWLAFERDRLLQGRVPHIVYDANRGGFRVTGQLHSAQNFRNRTNGNLQSVEALQPKEARPGKWTFAFQFEQLQKPFFDECRKRNIRIIFISIPAEGYDTEWSARVAKIAGIPHITVDPSDIEYLDGIHMSARGRQVFSGRPAQALLANSTTASMIHSIRSDH